MAREFAKSFYNSKAWKRARTAYIAMKFGICERCGKPNAKQVHHKVWLNENNINNPEVSLNFDNFELVCDICHQHEHNERYSAVADGLMFDNKGQLVKRNTNITGNNPPV
jgi:5-methylcytosine-specific restriction endonuclease McrA